jgi:F420-0:gamma-glutamyl ligase-like protein
VVAVIAAVGLIGFTVGRLNTHFLTCEDFQIAGDDEPKGCFHRKHP